MSRHDDAEAKRNEWLRRRLLNALRLAGESAPTGRLSGPTLKRQAEAGEPHDGGFDSDGHCLRLLRDLAAFGLAAETKGTVRRTERFGLEHVEYGITPDGVRLCLEQVPPVKGVWDERQSFE